LRRVAVPGYPPPGRLRAGDGIGALDVRLVPITAHQIAALESLQRAVRILADDFQREVGAADDETIAGGLYWLWSTLDTIQALWRDDGRDPARVEGWRRALEYVRERAPTEELRALAENVLDSR
jgi:hypothetical protein